MKTYRIATGTSMAQHHELSEAQYNALRVVLASWVRSLACPNESRWRVRNSQRTSARYPWDLSVNSAAVDGLRGRGLVVREFEPGVGYHYDITDETLLGIWDHTPGLHAEIDTLVASLAVELDKSAHAAERL